MPGGHKNQNVKQKHIVTNSIKNLKMVHMKKMLKKRKTDREEAGRELGGRPPEHYPRRQRRGVWGSGSSG